VRDYPGVGDPRLAQDLSDFAPRSVHLLSHDVTLIHGEDDVRAARQIDPERHLALGPGRQPFKRARREHIRQRCKAKECRDAEHYSRLPP